MRSFSCFWEEHAGTVRDHLKSACFRNTRVTRGDGSLVLKIAVALFIVAIVFIAFAPIAQ